jgi:hypothetical protein
MLRWHTLARMKKREHVRTKEKKSKVDKKDDIVIVLFSFYIFLIILFGLPQLKKLLGSGLLRKFPTFSGGKKVPTIKKRNRSL